MFILLCTGQFKVYSQPSWIPNESSIVSGDIRFKFKDTHPEYLIENIKAEDIYYIIRFSRIVEFIDKNDNNVYDSSDIITAIGVLCEKVVWDITYDERRIDDVTELMVNLSARIRVIKIGMQGYPISYARVTLVHRIFDRDIMINAYEIKGQYELKIDIIIEDWPWHKKQSKIALLISIEGYKQIEKGRYKKHKPKMHFSKEEIRHNVINKIYIISPDAKYGVEFRIANKVRIDGNESIIHGVKELRNESIEEQFAITYPRFDRILYHDPSIRIFFEEEEKIGVYGITAGIVISIMMIALAAVTILKIRRLMRKM